MIIETLGFLYAGKLIKIITCYLETFGGGSLTAPTAAFILMGKTGVGKSSFIKLVGGRDVQNGGEPKVDSGIDSCKKSSCK